VVVAEAAVGGGGAVLAVALRCEVAAEAVAIGAAGTVEAAPVRTPSMSRPSSRPSVIAQVAADCGRWGRASGVRPAMANLPTPGGRPGVGSRPAPEYDPVPDATSRHRAAHRP